MATGLFLSKKAFISLLLIVLAMWVLLQSHVIAADSEAAMIPPPSEVEVTSFAFIMGVVPMVLSTGAGSEMRNDIGVAVFSGMLGVTFFGLFFTPIFYVIMRKIEGRSYAIN